MAHETFDSRGIRQAIEQAPYDTSEFYTAGEDLLPGDLVKVSGDTATKALAPTDYVYGVVIPRTGASLDDTISAGDPVRVQPIGIGVITYVRLVNGTDTINVGEPVVLSNTIAGLVQKWAYSGDITATQSAYTDTIAWKVGIALESVTEGTDYKLIKVRF